VEETNAARAKIGGLGQGARRKGGGALGGGALERFKYLGIIGLVVRNMAVGRVVNVNEMVGSAVENAKNLWSRGRIAVVEAATGTARSEVTVKDGGEHDEWNPTPPTAEFKNYIGTSWGYVEMEYLTLRLPPPQEVEKGAAALRQLLLDFFAERGEEREFNFSDGAAVFESLVDFCSEAYGQYSTRGLEATVYDGGGDYSPIKVKLTWLG
jgi:hypothetical protein